jgi:hypothetical protein
LRSMSIQILPVADSCDSGFSAGAILPLPRGYCIPA